MVYSKKNSELAADNISQLYCDNTGNIWVLSQHFYSGFGLAVFSGENSVEYNKNNSGILDQMLHCIYCDEQETPGSEPMAGFNGLMAKAGNYSIRAGLHYMGTWESGKGMPTARAWLGSTVANGKIYVFGGYSGLRGNDPVYENCNQEYDPATDTWSIKSSMSVSKCKTKACTVGDKIYVIGGL